MTVMMHDAVALLSHEAKCAYANGDLSDLSYADDTLLIGVNCAHLEEYLTAVAITGRRFGMELHSSKFQLLNVRCNIKLKAPDGHVVEGSPGMSYLGTVLKEDGDVSSELTRRIGCAKADFRALRTVWKHCSLGRKRKLQIFQSLIQSKLFYSLQCCCITKAHLQRLDGFHARCIRVHSRDNGDPVVIYLTHFQYNRIRKSRRPASI